MRRGIAVCLCLIATLVAHADPANPSDGPDASAPAAEAATEPPLIDDIPQEFSRVDPGDLNLVAGDRPRLWRFAEGGGLYLDPVTPLACQAWRTDDGCILIAEKYTLDGAELLMLVASVYHGETPAYVEPLTAHLNKATYRGRYTAGMVHRRVYYVQFLSAPAIGAFDASQWIGRTMRVRKRIAASDLAAFFPEAAPKAKTAVHPTRPTPRTATKQPATRQPRQQTTTVYITRTGKKFHRPGCRFLKKSKIPISRDQAIKRGYKPCSVCKP